MHGEIFKAWCRNCDARQSWTGDLAIETSCPHCGATACMRPDVVWFGEVPYQLDRIATLLRGTDLFLSIGTSGNVYPAAGFVALAREAGARTIELNLEPSEGASLFDEKIHGPATEVVPAYVDKLLAAKT